MRNVAGGVRRIAVAALGSVVLVTSSGARAHDFRSVWNDGCCEQNVRECNARPGHPDYRCRHGHEADGPLEGAGVFDISCWGEGCVGWGPCEPEIETGSVPEVDNDMDDDCDGYVDDEQCDGEDNDGDGAIDEDIGSCMMRLVFVPACFDGSQGEFEAMVRGSMDFFMSRNGVTECTDNIHFEIINKSVLNLDCSGFDSESRCDSGTDTPLSRWRAAAAASTAFNLNEFDIMVVATDEDICGDFLGQSNQKDTIWMEVDDEVGATLAHEIGHVQGLGDEYCSQMFGSTDPRCNTGSPPAPPPVNWLGADLGCNPASSSCCYDTCEGVNACCEGNENPQGGRCVMSAGGAEEPRYFCERCATHIFAPPNARSLTNPMGQVPMDCAFAHLGNTSILNLAYRMDSNGAIDVASHTVGRGRLGVGGAGSAGNYGIEVHVMSPSNRTETRSLRHMILAALSAAAVGCSQHTGDSETEPLAELQTAALAAAPGDGEPVDRNNPVLAAQRDQTDPDYKKARIAADRAALATQRSALMELERARRAGALSTEQQRELDSRIEALRGRVAKREQRVSADEVSTK